MNRSGYVDVDKLQAETTLEDAFAKCGASIEIKGSGSEVRIDCPFGCDGDHQGRKEIAINVENPQKVFQCHAYTCGFRGNLLSLMHGLLTGSKPTAGKLKGAEFQRVRNVLAGKTATATVNPSQSATQKKDLVPPTAEPHSEQIAKPAANKPLIESDDERIRELNDIDQKFVTDLAVMNPRAAAYVRRHHCLTPESMKKLRCGYLPNDGGGDKRGWSLRGHIVYPVLSETGKVLAWVGRDVAYEEKEQAFQQLSPAERAGKDPPAKHRFPKGFHRGNELFGQHASRLNEPGYREFIAKHGLIIVEGFNDVINLDNFGLPALGIMSNRITETQVSKITAWARQFANNRVNLMFDCDPAGIEGAKDALWQFAERRLGARLLWPAIKHNGEFNNSQPEMVPYDELASYLAVFE